MMETLREFRRRVVTPNHPKVYRIRNSWGIYDGYKYYRKNKPDSKEFVLSESQYFAITRMVNQILAERLSRGQDVKFPLSMGSLEVRKYDRNVRIGKDGRIHTNLPVDWNSTLELWYNDPDAHKNKILVRHNVQEIYRIYYNRDSANYRNNYFYEFSVHQDIRRKLKQKIKEGVVDAFLLKSNIRYGE